ncbi:reverse transcriptase [Gossypium australe]|uniref:Reverse transcriptase n=1 Tax=Gossypium australe TaxID=47621 RepID=A0A5B6VPA3_9ROSI|nr:reverse transcriptase [Gossypium australe]
MERVRRSYGFLNGLEVDPDVSKGGLCLAWKEEVSILVQSFSRRHIDALGGEESWNTLKSLRNNEEQSWFVCGDFNEIIYGFKKKGGLPREKKRMEDFRNALEDCQLIDVGYSGNWFTWERGNLPKTNIRERLDRGVANVNWMSMFPEANIKHLVHSTSDHCPLLITTIKEEYISRPENFKFEAWWVLEETFEAEVKRIWDSALGTINFEIDKDESYWEQRARVKWLKLGDRNTTFFHSIATQK